MEFKVNELGEYVCINPGFSNWNEVVGGDCKAWKALLSCNKVGYLWKAEWQSRLASPVWGDGVLVLELFENLWAYTSILVHF